MRVIRLQSSNIKRIVAIDITPTSDMIMITGRNGAGKSSVLDSIYFALCGNSVIDKEPIRKGQDKATITIDLGEYVVTRSFSKKASYLKIEGKDGTKIQSPQKLLDQIVGAVSFDPLDFINNKSPAEQRKLLLSLMGVDTAPLDIQEKDLREHRTVVGRYRDKFSALVASIPHHPDVTSTKPISVADLSQSLEKAAKYNDSIIARTSTNEDRKKKGESIIQEIKSIDQQILDLQTKRSAHLVTIEELKTAYRAEAAEISNMVPIDVDRIRQSISSSDSINQKIRENEKYNESLKEFNQAEADYKKDTLSIESIIAARKSALSTASIPVTGLTVDEDGIEYNGIPLDQASDGEKLMIGLGISMAMNPTLRVIRIKDGSLLDASNRELIRAMIAEKDFQVWMETVGEDGQAGILIEEGEVVGAGKAEGKAEVKTESASIAPTDPIPDPDGHPAFVHDPVIPIPPSTPTPDVEGW
jgi:DNA repair exonuclease SbcCD ATPase subunit